MLTYLVSGIVLGVSAGISPGPLLALVISHTLQHGPREGAKVALAPLLTDVVIIGVAFLLFAAVPNLDMVLGIVSMGGACFVCYLGVHSLRQKAVELELNAAPPRSLLKGATVNALSPHPHLFWFTVGVPMMIKAADVTIVASVGFAVLFLFCLVGSKMLLAALVGKSRHLLSGRPYIWVMRTLGLVLILFAVKLLYDGLDLLGVVG